MSRNPFIGVRRSHSPRRLRLAIAAMFAVGLLFLPVAKARAHAAFESSCRLIARPEQIELCITMGKEGGVQFLKLAGLSGSGVDEATRPQPGPGYSLLPEMAATLFEVNDQDGSLPVESLCVNSDGTDIIFTATCEPGAGTLEFRALYLVDYAGPGASSFVALDERTNQLAVALLSRDESSIRFQLPFSADAESSAGIPPPSSGSRFGEFLKLGVVHILTGFDHLLFLTALILGVRKPAPMLGVVTCFTLAHSLTLALAALNFVTITPRIIEPVIAASIIVVGVENLLRKDIVADRYWLAGTFGLIHGFGFAGTLRETGLGQPGASIVAPLFSFNLGVEAGQVAVMSAVLPLLFLLRNRPSFARYAVPAISAMIILVSGYWLVERTFGSG